MLFRSHEQDRPLKFADRLGQRRQMPKINVIRHFVGNQNRWFLQFEASQGQEAFLSFRQGPHTINSITSVNLDSFSPEPMIDGKGTHGGYCGPAVKPIAMNMVAEIARNPATHGLPISGIGGITTWRDAAEFMALGAGNVQVCTAVMTYGFKIVSEMISGLSEYLDAKQIGLSDLIGRAVPNVTDWQYLNLNYVAKAKIDQDACIKCGRCYAACEDTSHQAIAMKPGRVFEVMDDECVACNLCVDVCPVTDCITMVPMQAGQTDPRTGRVVSGEYANWTSHPNNPSVHAAE